MGRMGMVVAAAALALAGCGTGIRVTPTIALGATMVQLGADVSVGDPHGSRMLLGGEVHASPLACLAVGGDLLGELMSKVSDVTDQATALVTGK